MTLKEDKQIKNMKKFIIILFALMLSISCFSENNLSSLVKSLKKSGVDSIITLTVVEGGIWAIEKITNDTCSPAGYYHGVYINIYVVWKKEGRCYFTKVHPCIDYKPTKVKCLSLFLFINKNITRIRKEKIYPEELPWREGFVNRDISIYLKNKVIHFDFNETDLKEKYNPKNFNHNLKLKQIEFTKMLLNKLKSIDIGKEHKMGLFL